MAKRKHYDLDGSTSYRYHQSQHAKKRKLSDESSVSRADGPGTSPADSVTVDSSLQSIRFVFDVGDPPVGMSAAARKRWRRSQRLRLAKRHGDAGSASPARSKLQPRAKQPSRQHVHSNHDSADGEGSGPRLCDISRTRLMQRPIKRWIERPSPPARDVAPMSDEVSEGTTPSAPSITLVQNVPVDRNGSMQHGRLNGRNSAATSPASDRRLVPQIRRQSSATTAARPGGTNNMALERDERLSACSRPSSVASRSYQSGIMDRLPSFMRTGSSNQLSALKMRIEPKFTSVPDRLRRPSDINRVPQMLSFLNNRTGYGSDDEDGNEDSDSSDGQVEGSERPAVSTLHTVASRHAEDPDGNAAQTAIDCVQEPSVAQPMSPVPSPVIPHTQSIAEAYDPTIELDALRSGGAAQYSQGEAQHEDEGEQTCGPHGINVNPSTWQPISHSPVEGDVTIVVRPNTEVPLFEQVVAQSVSPEKPVASSPPTEDAALHSDEELERTITDVSSAVFDATRPLPISEVQHDHQYEERLLATGTPSDYNGNDNSSDLSSVQRLKQAALPPRYVSPIVSIPRTSPLEDVEDMVDVEDFATDAGGDEDMMHLDRSAADEIDEGAGNEHEIEISGSSMDRDEVMDGAEDDGETDDIAHASKADGTLQTNDPGDLNSSVDACDMLSTEDLDGADPMQTIEEEMLVGALPDRSQEASQQLLNDAMNAMLAEQPSPGKSARYARSHSLPGNDVMIDDVVVPGSKSSALAGSDTFVVIQHFDRRIESPTVREKRKMTGITSKHFTPVKSARKKRAGKAIDPHDILDADANADDDLTAHSSASLYDTPGSATTYPTRSRRKAQSNASKASTYATAPETPVQPADEVTSVPRTSSTTRKRRVPAGTSASPVPPITEKYFGLIQDKLWTEPFWLLVAVIFLNLTTGRTAAPVFWALKEDYPTPEALAAIDASELFNRIERLGLANNRTKTILGLAKTWVEFPPVKGVRYRKLHYPNRYDGKEYKPADVIESDSELIEGLIEIAHLPGCGHYALDSWRIFCRDVLRCVATDFNGEGAEDANFEPEWMRVLPLDKELRACLRWMWMREGFVWDVKTGKKRPATAEELEKARKGEMAIDDVGEKKFAVAAAADAASGGNVDAAEVARPGSGDEAVQNAAEEGGKKTKRKSRTKKVRKSLQRQESAELQASAAESVVKRRSRRSRSSE